MTPLARAAWGFLIVVVDFRVDGLDVVPDFLGWALVLAGLAALAGRGPWFTAATVAAGIGLLVSVPQFFAEAGPGLSAVQLVVDTGFVFGTCTGIMRLVDEPARTTANRIRWTNLGLTAVAVTVGLSVGEMAGLSTGGETQVSGGAAALVLVLVLAGLALVVWFLIFLLSVQHHPALGSRQPQAA